MISESSYDWICVGSGAAGLASAAAAADYGLRALVLEKQPVIGGATAWSYGSLWVGCNHVQRATGLDDSPAETRAYLTFLAGGLADPARLERYAAEAPRVVEYFDRLGVAFQEVASLPDHYYPIAPGAKPRGRTLEVQPFPRAALGAWADRLEDTPYMPRGVTWSEVLSWGGFGNAHQWDPAQLAARRDRFGAGQGLAAALLRAALARGVEVRTAAPVTRLMVEDGRVTGVAVAVDGRAQLLRARRGVLLACGGYEGNPTLMAALEDFGDAPTHFPPGVTGDGLIIAAEHGALVRKVALRLSTMLGYFVPGEAPDAPPHFQSAGINELAYPHTIVVNRRGARFADESFFQGIVPRLLDFDVPTHAPANRPCYLVFDEQFARRYGFAGRPPGQRIPPWMPRADSPRALAGRLGIDPDGLQATLAAFNTGARDGVDPAFGRGQSAWARRSAGDASHQQNPNLGTVEEAPFYGVELVPSPSVSGGLTADPDARIIHVRGYPIPGLYGAGNTCAVTEYGVGYQAGLTLTSSLTFGTLAVEHALGEAV